jgi:hypothetical protein
MRETTWVGSRIWVSLIMEKKKHERKTPKKQCKT